MNSTNPTPDNLHLSGHDHNVASMFGRIAKWYDFLNHFLSLGMDFYWRKRLIHQVQVGTRKRILDLAAGTMDVSKQLNQNFPDCHILAADFSVPMLQHGLRKDTSQKINPVCADAKNLPFSDQSFDCVTIAFGIRNVLPRSPAYSEIMRTLIPGGKLCILEFGSGRQKIWGGLYNLYLFRVLPLVGKIISRDIAAYSYLSDTIRAFPESESLREELRQAGFESTEYLPLSSSIVVLHLAHKPLT